MTQMKTAVRGQGAPKANLNHAFLKPAFHRIRLLVLALMLSGPAIAGTPPADAIRCETPAVQAKLTVVQFDEPAGAGAFVDVAMDAEYVHNYPHCTISVTLGENNEALIVDGPGNTCLPQSGAFGIAVITTLNTDGTVHAQHRLVAVDGVVNTVVIEP